MRERALAWRVEETCLNAWPALQEVLLDDWLLRFSDGHTRRANSANPRHAAIRDVKEGIVACENFYRARGLPALFRIPSIVDSAAEETLQQFGYAPEGETCTLYGDLAEAASARDSEVELLSRPSSEWLAARAALQGFSNETSTTYGRIIDSIAIPAAFGAIRVDDQIAALAFGAIHDGLLCCESVFTDVLYRQRGYARRILGALNEWAEGSGAMGICIQVEATNGPARALYRALGLKTELYRYHYRRQPTLN